jgi:LmbE family N-acetylglucosaminyl deacetylase
MRWLPQTKLFGKYGRIEIEFCAVIMMLKLELSKLDRQLKILCLGAHSDDIEIGCGGTILRIADEVPEVQFYWVVFSGDEKRRKEADESARLFLENAFSKEIVVHNFRESYFPFVGALIKDYFEKLKDEFSPDLIFTHYDNDAHQDHQLISSLTWNTFRDHLILEYEIPKYDGDVGTPNLYVHLNESHVDKKIKCLCSVFQTQKEKQWFDEETFRSILRIRGIESNSISKYAEAFYCRKIIF